MLRRLAWKCAALLFIVALTGREPVSASELSSCTYCVYGAQCDVATIRDLCSTLCGGPSGLCGEHPSCAEGGFYLSCFGPE